MRRLIRIDSIVARSRYEQNAGPVESSYGVGLRRRKPIAAVTVVQHTNVSALHSTCAHPQIAHQFCVRVGANCIARSAVRWPKKLERHDFDLPVYAHNANAIVANRSDCSRHVRAVRVRSVVARRTCIDMVVAANRPVAQVAGYEVPSLYVVNESVAIVVNSVTSNLAGIRPYVRLQIRMIDVYAFVNYANDYVAAAVCDVPGLLRVYVRARSAARLACVLQAV